jgi:hypothetical protein
LFVQQVVAWEKIHDNLDQTIRGSRSNIVSCPEGFEFPPELLDSCALLADDDAWTRGMWRPHDLPPRKQLPGLPLLMPIADYRAS